MGHRLVILRTAAKELADLTPEVQRRVAGQIEGLAANPFPLASWKLTGTLAGYRIRES